jgi:hypothetical protein
MLFYILYSNILIKKCKWDLIILRRCQLYIKDPFKLQPEDCFIKAETCSCCVRLINYILCNKVVLHYKFTYVINYRKHKGDTLPENYPNCPVFNRTGRGFYAYSVWTLLMMDWVANCIFKFLNQLHKNMGIPETHETGDFISAYQQVITANLMIWWYTT